RQELEGRQQVTVGRTQIERRLSRELAARTLRCDIDRRAAARRALEGSGRVVVERLAGVIVDHRLAPLDRLRLEPRQRLAHRVERCQQSLAPGSPGAAWRGGPRPIAERKTEGEESGEAAKRR